jgi:mercuric ion binding protein
MNNPLAFLLATVLCASTAVAAESRTATLEVANMDCAVCPITVRKALEKVPGVASAKVDLKSKSAVVVFDPARASPEALTRATTDAGYPSTVKRLQ